jgi:hypothetical protein
MFCRVFVGFTIGTGLARLLSVAKADSATEHPANDRYAEKAGSGNVAFVSRSGCNHGDSDGGGSDDRNE